MRDRRDEMMDDPKLDVSLHRAALQGLARINRLSFASKVLYTPIRDYANSIEAPVRIVDIASGSADIPIAILHKANAEGIRIEFVACDVSAVALEQAQRAASRAGVPLETRCMNILHEPIPSCDIVTCSLFTHHLTDDQIRVLVERIMEADPGLVLINDLRRCLWGRMLAAVIPRLITRSQVVHNDAVLSARAALTPRELGTIVEGAGMVPASIRRRFPARMLLEWKRNP